MAFYRQCPPAEAGRGGDTLDLQTPVKEGKRMQLGDLIMPIWPGSQASHSSLAGVYWIGMDLHLSVYYH